MDTPPSTWMVCPVMKLASPMHNNMTVPNIAWRADTAHRRPATLVPGSDGLEHLGRQPAHHAVVGGAGTNDIHGDATTAQRDREIAHQRILRGSLALRGAAGPRAGAAAP